MLTAKQKELHDFIAVRVRESGVAPSFEEMKEALGLRSKSGVHRLVGALEQRGFVRRLAYRARAIELIREPGDNVIDLSAARAERAALRESAVTVPLHGRIAAGQPVEAHEDPDASLTVPMALLGPGDHYALQVSGDSMVDAGIFDGDFALIRKADTARDGDIVVALVDNHEATLKYLRLEKGMVRLDPANAAHQAQIYLPSRVKVQGKLAGLLRRY